jgi:hypothetical protein
MLNITLSEKKMKLSYVLALATVLGSSLHTNTMQQQSEQLRRSKETIPNNSDIQKQQKAGFILLGVGALGLLLRRPIIAVCCLAGGAIALKGERCDGIKEMEEGIKTIRKQHCTDKMIQGTTEFVTGCGKFGYSLLLNGIDWARKSFPEKTTKQEAQSEESDE